MKEAQTALTPAGSDLAEKPKWRRWEVPGICALLVIMVVLVFGHTVRYGFVNLDDNTYISENAFVSKGLTLEGLRGAFRVCCNQWQPLTMVSHMLACQVFGLWAGGHHLVNVLLHAIGVVLLFLMLREMTGALWRSAFVAAVFAIHPLRVESVVWVAERKDVLSGIFFMLTLWVYTRYARTKESNSVPSRRLYAMVVVWFVLGLLSKPMLVTVPCVLLLLDYWPLGRFKQIKQFPRLLWEKLPLFALAAASCVATLLAAKGDIERFESFALSMRVENALVAYAVYLLKLACPARLAFFYPTLKNGWSVWWSVWQVVAAFMLLAGFTAWALVLRRKQPFLVVGWLWYLGMLVPVIGIVKVLFDPYSDRYSYLPQIGLCVAATWAAANFAGEWRYRRMALGGMAVVVLCVLSAVAYNQTSYWRDSITLWNYILDCTQDKSIVHFKLGSALQEQGRAQEAIAQYYQALRINPAYVEAHNNLGNALLRQGQTEEAIAQYHEALRINPAFADAHNNLGSALQQQGRTEEAIARYREALRINPANAQVHYNLGNALFAGGRTEEAIEHLHNALELQPANAIIQISLAWMLATAPQSSLRNGARAVELATQANQSSGGKSPVILRTLAAAYAEGGDFQNAVQTAQAALQLAEAQSNTNLATKLRGEIKLYEAHQPYREWQ